MFKKIYSALMLLMISSMMLNAATDSDELASIAPEEGCYASLRNYLFKKKTMFDDPDVMGGDESDQGDQGDQGDQEPEEPETEEPEVAADEETDQEIASDESDDELAASDNEGDDTEVAPEKKEEPEVAPEGVLGVDEEGTMSGPAPEISPEEQAAADAAEENPDVALILQNFNDNEDDFDEEALIGALLGAGVAAGLAALLAKKFMDMKKKKQAGNLDGQPKVTADDKTLHRVQSGEIRREPDITPRRPAPGIPVSVRPVSVTDRPESNIRPGGMVEVVKSDKPDLLKENAKAIGKELKALNERGIVNPSDVAKATKYQRQAAVRAPLPAGAKDPLAALRARLAEKGKQGLPAVVAQEPSPLEKALAKQKAKVDAVSPDLPRRNLAADDAEQARLKALATENAKKKAAREAPRKFVGKHGVKG